MKITWEQRIKFLARVDTRGPDECWPWIGKGIKPDGRGRIRVGKIMIHTPAMALIVSGQPRPPFPKNNALHSCDNPPCCNPKHLRWGTKKDNTQDAIDRGRFALRRVTIVAAKGEAHGLSKLKEKEVIAIRQATGTYRSIGDKYKVSSSTVSRIKNGLFWKHI